GVRRSLAGAQRPPWRSGARRPDSNAGREPKGAIALPCFRVMAAELLHHFYVLISGQERKF
ncbi:hypothetical protein, partial [Enterobacter hormaechei]|uniref:hypothetical protein n=1 Tax=Enterobacter hormaechei TaxID=158836 RepID=UPI001EDB1D5B